MAKRKRDVPVLFWVSAEELELIHQKMQQYGTENLSAICGKWRWMVMWSSWNCRS